MTGSEMEKQMPSTEDGEIAVVPLTRLDINAITQRASQLRAAETGRLLREAWLTLSSLWRGPRHLLPPAKRREAVGTSS